MPHSPKGAVGQPGVETEQGMLVRPTGAEAWAGVAGC